MQEVYKTYEDRADFILVYLREAHPTDGRRPARHVKIKDPTSIEERDLVAGRCTETLKMTMPCVVDDMKDTVSKAYNAKPDRLFILGEDAKIVYRGDRGPRGFDIDGMEAALKSQLAAVASAKSGAAE